MAFAYQGSDLRHVHNYEHAVRYYEECYERRPRSWGDGAPLHKNNKDYARVFKYAGGDVAFRYHDTDCLTFSPDGTLSIRCWESQSTSTFMTRLAPPGLSFHMTSSIGYLCTIRASMRTEGGDAPAGMTWKVSDSTLFNYSEVAGGWVLDEIEPFEIPVIDAELAAAARKKYRYFDFRDYCTARIGLGYRHPPKPKRYGKGNHFHPDEIDYRTVIELLSTDNSEGEWDDVIDLCYGEPKYALHCLYRYEKAATYKTVKYIRDYHHQKYLEAQLKKYDRCAS